MTGTLVIISPCTIQSPYAISDATYMRFEIASMSPSRQALSTCGTKLRLVHNPAARPNAVSHHVCMFRAPLE
jgi:hypothetical protein